MILGGPWGPETRLQPSGPTGRRSATIMNGGGWDLIAANGSATAVSSIGQTFEQHLAKVATDGTVQRIIYFLYPEIPTPPGVTSRSKRARKAPCPATSSICSRFGRVILNTQPLTAFKHPKRGPLLSATPFGRLCNRTVFGKPFPALSSVYDSSTNNGKLNDFQWAQQDLNLRLRPCEERTLPLSYAPK